MAKQPLNKVQLQNAQDDFERVSAMIPLEVRKELAVRLIPLDHALAYNVLSLLEDRLEALILLESRLRTKLRQGDDITAAEAGLLLHAKPHNPLCAIFKTMDDPCYRSVRQHAAFWAALAAEHGPAFQAARAARVKTMPADNAKSAAAPEADYSSAPALLLSALRA